MLARGEGYMYRCQATISDGRSLRVEVLALRFRIREDPHRQIRRPPNVHQLECLQPPPFVGHRAQL